MHASRAGSTAQSAGIVVVGACQAGIAVGGLEVAEGARVALDGEFGAVVGIGGVAGEGGLDEQDVSTVTRDSSTLYVKPSNPPRVPRYAQLSFEF